MKAALRIPAVYLLFSALWLAGADRAFASMLPWSSPMAGAIQHSGFVLLSSALIYLLVSHERNRRDAVEFDLRKRASHDPLTGLLNRACLLDILRSALQWADGDHREERKVGVVFVDLDGFKRVNDSYGHHTGDRVLVEVSKRLRGEVRKGDFAGRFGGDEFVVLVHGDQAEGCRRLAERLVDRLNAPIAVDGIPIRLSASVGFAIYPDHGTEGEDLLRAADLAMYRVKELGKNAALEAYSSAA